MNNNSVVFFHMSDTNNYNNVYDICTKVNLHLFDCQKLDILAYIMEKVCPRYIIIDTNGKISKNICLNIANKHKDCFVYIIDTDYLDISKNNIYIVENCKQLELIIANHYRCFSNIIELSSENERQCYSCIINELDKLYFRPKLIGAKYMTELIYELFTNSSISNIKCNAMYKKIGYKYNAKVNSIERAIRFSINKAYQNCKEKSLFHNISKTEKIPTIKEIANYILDKIILEINKTSITSKS